MLTLIKPGCGEVEREKRMDQVIGRALQERDAEVEVLGTAEELAEADLAGQTVIFAICLSVSGMNMEWYRMMDVLRRRPGCMTGATGGVIVDGSGELDTKKMARETILTANLCGCDFPGRPLVEATGSLNNFHIVSKVLGVSEFEAYCIKTGELIARLENFSMPRQERPDILMVHASSRSTSNSLWLWENVREKIGDGADITEISIRNGEVYDCKGCRFEDCLHFGERGGCFYGGVIVDKVYPAIISCDALVLVCPNYNDAVSANITAFINRLTAVFRANDFSSKKLFAIVVSGYSGGDIVAEQIIGAMNCNKNFILPGNFAMIETGNDPGSVKEIEGIDLRSAEFADRIMG